MNADLVVFRKFSDGQVIALFPAEPVSCEGPHLFNSYMHVGQHGGAAESIVETTRLAKPEEYADLLEEIVDIGYKPIVRKRMTPQMREARTVEWNRMMKETA